MAEGCPGRRTGHGCCRRKECLLPITSVLLSYPKPNLCSPRNCPPTLIPSDRSSIPPELRSQTMVSSLIFPFTCTHVPGHQQILLGPPSKQTQSVLVLSNHPYMATLLVSVFMPDRPIPVQQLKGFCSNVGQTTSFLCLESSKIVPSPSESKQKF